MAYRVGIVASVAETYMDKTAKQMHVDVHRTYAYHSISPLQPERMNSQLRQLLRLPKRGHFVDLEDHDPAESPAGIRAVMCLPA